MNAVAVDPVARGARVGGGALLGEVDRATQAHGLVVPAGVVSHTGVGGLTLGGGVGRLMRRFGLTIDSLLGASVVTADGEVLAASETEQPDLFWGLRGGGGNFGVVTEFEFALHELLRAARSWARSIRCEARPSVLAHGAAAMAAPERPTRCCGRASCARRRRCRGCPSELVGRPGMMSLIEWSGEPRRGARAPGGDRRASCAPACSARRGAVPRRSRRVTDEIFAAGKRTYIKAGFARELSDELIDALCAPRRAGRSRSSRRSRCSRWAGRSPRVPADGNGVSPSRRARG